MTKYQPHLAEHVATIDFEPSGGRLRSFPDLLDCLWPPLVQSDHLVAGISILQLQFCKGIPDTIPEFTDGRVTVIA
jgi:hypothetical protein